MRYSAFNIHFIRRNETDGDDIIRIVPNKNVESYSIKYKISKNYSKTGEKKEYTMVLPREYLLDYIDTLMNIVCKDESPFDDYQIDLPGIPSVLVNQWNLADTINDVKRALSILMLSDCTWPCID